MELATCDAHNRSGRAVRTAVPLLESQRCHGLLGSIAETTLAIARFWVTNQAQKFNNPAQRRGCDQVRRNSTVVEMIIIQILGGLPHNHHVVF